MPTGQPGTKAPHGTEARYTNHGCRCDECRAANTAAHRERAHRLGWCRPADVVNAERLAAALARDNHGTETRYRRGCRCDGCRAASADARADRRRRRAHAA